MNTVSLGEDLGIEASAELKERLTAHLQSGDLSLDGRAVRRVHTAAMQVLCAFFRSRHDLGRRTELSGCSDALRDAARLLGLSAQLGLTDQQDSNKKEVENAA